MNTIQSLWVSGSLSPVEQVSIKSFLRAGHPFRLYTYDIDGRSIPRGTQVLDAKDIVPRSKIDKFQNLANFSDFFRYSMLYRNGGWWCDLDVFCLSPFDFSEPYVFAKQISSNPGHPEDITSCVIKVPQCCDLMHWCQDEVSRTNTRTNGWADIGPMLLMRGVPLFGLEKYAKSKWVFCPLDHFDAPANIFGPDSQMARFTEDTHAIHMWNEEARRAGIDKFAFHPGSLFERFKELVQ
jgi:hypothetical protein